MNEFKIFNLGLDQNHGIRNDCLHLQMTECGFLTSCSENLKDKEDLRDKNLKNRVEGLDFFMPLLLLHTTEFSYSGIIQLYDHIS